MTTFRQERWRFVAFGGMIAALALVGTSGRADAAVTVTNDPTTFSFLEKPYGDPDETSLGGFNYWISSRVGSFRENDQYVNAGNETEETTAIGANLGDVSTLSGTPFNFSIQHVVGKGFAFGLTDANTVGATPSLLYWGDFPPTSATSQPTLDGQPPVTNFNGLQIQVRAQEVMGSSVTVANVMLSGLTIAPGSDPLFSGTVTPATPSTIPLDAPGRVGQWILGNDLALLDWMLTGQVTIVRTDDATSDLTKVRLAVDLVRDTRIAPIPLPAALPLFVSAIAGLAVVVRRRRGL